MSRSTTGVNEERGEKEPSGEENTERERYEADGEEEHVEGNVRV